MNLYFLFYKIFTSIKGNDIKIKIDHIVSFDTFKTFNNKLIMIKTRNFKDIWSEQKDII